MPKFTPIPQLTPDELERFWSKVDKTSDPNGCHLWTDSTIYHGYGRFRLRDHFYPPHRIAYSICVGPIPDGFEIDHVRSRGCIHRHCVNPDHLEAVTTRENLMRSSSFVAVNAAKTHCKRGHEFTPENTRLTADNKRHCRTCQREWMRAFRAERKAA